MTHPPLCVMRGESRGVCHEVCVMMCVSCCVCHVVPGSTEVLCACFVFARETTLHMRCFFGVLFTLPIKKHTYITDSTWLTPHAKHHMTHTTCLTPHGSHHTWLTPHDSHRMAQPYDSHHMTHIAWFSPYNTRHG